MFTVTLYKFNKQHNSTKRPTEGGVNFQVRAMSPSSVLYPSVEFSGIENPSQYNYAYVKEWDRYYYITDWTYTSPFWIAGMSVDSLASWRGTIGSSTQFVVRSSAKADPSIIDGEVVATSAQTVQSVGPANGNPFTSNIAEGSFVVGIINSDSSAIGVTSYYVFTNAQFRRFCAALMGDADWAYSGIEEFSIQTFKSYFNPLQYVASCTWMPFRLPSGVGVDRLPYGWWSFPGVSCGRLDGTPVFLRDAAFTIPKHPSDNENSKWYSKSAFSDYTIDWPAIGSIVLDPAKVGGRNNLVVQVYVDPISTIATVVAMADGDLVYSGHSHVGVPIKLSQMGGEFIGGLVQTLGGAAASLGGDMAGGAAAALGGISSTAPTVSGGGVFGSVASYYFQPSLNCRFTTPAGRDIAHRGYPLCQNRQISGLPGFIQCQTPNLAITGSTTELQEILEKMEGGFYYE